MAVFRTENTSILWKKDPNTNAYGIVDARERIQDPAYPNDTTKTIVNTNNNSNPVFRFGLHETVQAPDPEIEWSAMYGPGSDRSRQTTFAGKWTLKGSVPDIRVQPGCYGDSIAYVLNDSTNQMEDRVIPTGNVAELFELILGKMETSIHPTIPAQGTPGSPNYVAPVLGWVDKWTIYDEKEGNYDGRLPFFTMQIAAKSTTNSNGTYVDWIRNYYGGKIGRATLTANEGEDLKLSLDDIIFKDIRYNNGAATTDNDYLDQPLLKVSSAAQRLSEKGRYLFAGAELKFTSAGENAAAFTLARVKRFTLSVDNQLEPKYYMSNVLLNPNGGVSGVPNVGHQVLSEIVEGKRSYTLDLELDFVDSGSDFKLFNYLLNLSGPTNKPLKGLQFVATFIPSEGVSAGNLTITCGVDPQSVKTGRPGGVITSGAVNIPAAPAGYMSATYNMDIDTVKIEITNSEVR